MKDDVTASIEKLVGRRIREQRIAVGLTQKALAEHLCVSPQQIQRYEAGINRLSPSLLVKVAARLDCTVGQLFGEFQPAGAVQSDEAILPRRRRYRRRSRD